MPDDLFDRLTRLAPEVDQEAALTALGRPRDRPWLSATAIAAVTVIAVVIVMGALLIALDDPQPQTVTAGPGDTGSTTTTVTTVPPVPSTVLRIAPPLPRGWQSVSGPLYVDIGFPPGFRNPPAEATVATFDVPAEPSRDCDFPVAALERLGADDAFVSVVEARVPLGAGPRPPATTFLPLNVPVDEVPLDQRDFDAGLCLSRTGDFRYNETLFAENGRFLRVHVGLGLDANDDIEAQVLEVVQRITVEPRTRVALGRVLLTVPNKSTVERQDQQDYGNGVTGPETWIRLPQPEGARVGPLCQVGAAVLPASTVPADARPMLTVRIEPFDGAAPFEMSRVAGSDTDLTGRIGDTTFHVDCDDLPTAQFVASHLNVPR